MNFITVERAKKEIERLMEYVYLVETYEADTMEKFIVKSYAETGSLDTTLDLTHRAGYGYHLEREDIVDVIKQRGKDELHKKVRSWYMKRTRAARR